jgi:7-keto-8-aminopelargonate synthetase-like enzyme
MNALALLLAAVFTIPSPTLVLRSGERVNVDDGVRVEERTVVFRSGANLYSVPLSEVDLDATRAAINTVVARTDDRGKLKVSAEERERLLRDLEKNHSGKATPMRPIEIKEPSRAEREAVQDDEWSWRRAARSHEESIRRAQEELELLQSRAEQLRQQIRGFVALGYRPNQFTYQSSELQLTLDSIPRAELEVSRAQRAYDQFKDDARRLGVMPGWLR